MNWKQLNQLISFEETLNCFSLCVQSFACEKVLSPAISRFTTRLDRIRSNYNEDVKYHNIMWIQRRLVLSPYQLNLSILWGREYVRGLIIVRRFFHKPNCCWQNTRKVGAEIRRRGSKINLIQSAYVKKLGFFTCGNLKLWRDFHFVLTWQRDYIRFMQNLE